MRARAAVACCRNSDNSDNSDMFIVQIVEHETERIVKSFDAQPTMRDAERLERGVNINLDHRHYYTEIVAENEEC